jgi:hypothetical protein
MRKDLHKIHELHSKSIYAVGRYFIYLIGIALIAYAAYLFFTAKEFWNDIGLVVVSNVSVIVGVFAIFYTGTMGYLIQHEHLRHKSVSFWDMFVLVLFPVGLISASVYTMFSQKASTVTEGKADFEISADKLIGEFEKDTKAASEKYIGKSVLFHGRVTEVAGDSSVLLKLASNQEGFTTNCGFDKSVYHEVKTVQSGDSVAVQCSCTGITKPEGEMDLLSESSLDMVRCKLLQIIKTKP